LDIQEEIIEGLFGERILAIFFHFQLQQSLRKLSRVWLKVDSFCYYVNPKGNVLLRFNTELNQIF